MIICNCIHMSNLYLCEISVFIWDLIVIVMYDIVASNSLFS